MEAMTQQSERRIPGQVLGILRCLSCGGTLCRAPQDEQDRGSLVCANCYRRYPLVKGVIRFVDAQVYARSFGFQWLTFKTTQLDNEQSRVSEADFRRRTGFKPEDLAGKLVLDVGCGMGRFAEVATRWGAHVVGIDLSLAAEAAVENLADRDADLFAGRCFPVAVRSRELRCDLQHRRAASHA